MFEIRTLPENPGGVIIPLTEHPEGKEVGPQLGEANSDSERQTLCNPGIQKGSGEGEGEVWKNKDMMMLEKWKWESKTSM